MTPFDKDSVWKIVKEIRKSFLLKYTEPDCQVYKTLLSDSNINDNIKNLAENLNLNTTSTPNDKVSDVALQTGGEMFTFLNFCPPKHLVSFLAHLFSTGTPKDVILAMSSIKMLSQNAAKLATVSIFSKVMSSFSLEQYEEIQTITKGKCFNGETFSKCVKAKDLISNQKGKVSENKSQFHMTNHPVHIHEDGALNPTALIPFCEFGGSMSTLGVKIDQMDIPVCNTFRPKVIQDQLCYTFDLNEFRDKIRLNNPLSLSLFLSYNEDRQMEDVTSGKLFVIIDTIGKVSSSSKSAST